MRSMQAFCALLASCSISSWPSYSSPSIARRCSSRSICGSVLSDVAPALHQSKLPSLRQICLAFSGVPVLRAGLHTRKKSFSGLLSGSRTLHEAAMGKVPIANTAVQGSKLAVAADPESEEALRHAEELLGVLRLSDRGRLGLGGEEEQAGSAGVVVTVDASSPADRPTIFFGRDEVKLLKIGEGPGEGLKSELPEVLRLQCAAGDFGGDTLVKACLGKKKPQAAQRALDIVDCTAGYGHDSLRLAAAGHRVKALERDAVVFAFLSSALGHLQRGRGTMYEERVSARGGTLSVECADSAEWLAARAREGVVYDVVYLDPMFPPKKRQSALPKRRMQWLREHLHTGGGDGEAERAELEALLGVACEVGRKVVIKRADDGPVIGKPSSKIESSKIVRYDVYVGCPRK